MSSFRLKNKVTIAILINRRFVFLFLDKLDGVRLGKKKSASDEPQTIDDWLQLSQSFGSAKAKPGKKTVSLVVYVSKGIPGRLHFHQTTELWLSF